MNIIPMKKDFPLEMLKISNVFYEFTQENDKHDAEIELIIEFEPIKIDGHEINPKFQFIGFSNPALEKSVFLSGYNFTDEDYLEPSSIYFQSVHNPVDLKALRIEKKDGKEIIFIDLFFDFEYEQTEYKNEKLNLTYEIKK